VSIHITLSTMNSQTVEVCVPSVSRGRCRGLCAVCVEGAPSVSRRAGPDAPQRARDATGAVDKRLAASGCRGQGRDTGT
jgi:hypothetical protein